MEGGSLLYGNYYSILWFLGIMEKKMETTIVYLLKLG